MPLPTRLSPAPGASVTPQAGVPEGSAPWVSLYASQQKLYPRAVRGWFAGWRWTLVWATQLLFYGLPWLQWNGRQAVLFELASRRFYIFGLVLHPQDFIYLTGLLIISAYALFLFTTVAGRLWCGFACPQTVYTEIFLWIERKFEGDRSARMKRDAAAWSAEKFLRKAGTQAAWIGVALLTGFTFVGYFTSIQTLAREASQAAFGPWEWFWVLFYGLATYGNAGYLREQVCKYMCPYARFQSAMFDKDTLIISYDAERGEPRGARGKKADAASLGLGDCVDCTLCVQVCPTGIDIRQGLQYECIGCAACIDVCNGVMDKVGYPRGLIRYATQNALVNHWLPAQMWARVGRPRVLVYAAILGLITLGLAASLALRKPFRVDVVRDRASLARVVEEGQVENVYRLQVMNGAETAQRFEFMASGLAGAQVVERTTVTLAPAEARWVTLTVRLPHAAAKAAGPGAHGLVFDIHRVDSGQGSVQVAEKSTFLVPR